METDMSYPKLTFTVCSHGWIDFVVSVEEQRVSIRASSWDDPFPRLLTWLEAIAIGVEECAFSFDEDGPDKEFRIFNRYNHTSRLVIGEPRHDFWRGRPADFLNARVDSRKLVAGFYQSLIVFSESPLYRKEHWQTTSVGECIRYELDGKWSNTDLVDSLMEYDNNQLEMILGKIDFAFKTGMYRQREKFKDFKSYLEWCLGRLEIDYVESLDLKCEPYSFHRDLDSMDDKDKRAFLEDALIWNVNNWDGCKIGSLRSDIIEGFIELEA
jgi:hypothetical protein